MNATATLTKTATALTKLNMRGNAWHYQIEPPIQKDGYQINHLIVSAAHNIGGENYVLIFESTANAEFSVFSPIYCHTKNMSHQAALAGAGYVLTNPEVM